MPIPVSRYKPFILKELGKLNKHEDLKTELLANIIEKQLSSEFDAEDYRDMNGHTNWYKRLNAAKTQLKREDGLVETTRYGYSRLTEEGRKHLRLGDS